MDKSLFKHRITTHVRFSEVDMLGVCNNAVYINYFEDARLDYFKKLGLIPRNGLFTDGRLFFVVRNELNYRAHAVYGDELAIYSRVSFIKNSSFGFEHIVENSSTGQIVVDGSGVLVQVDPVTRKSMPLPKEFYDKVAELDKDVKILKEI